MDKRLEAEAWIITYFKKATEGKSRKYLCSLVDGLVRSVLSFMTAEQVRAWQVRLEETERKKNGRKHDRDEKKMPADVK